MFDQTGSDIDTPLSVDSIASVQAEIEKYLIELGRVGLDHFCTGVDFVVQFYALGKGVSSQPIDLV